MTSRVDSHSRIYIYLLGVVTLGAGGLAYFSGSASLGLAAAVLGLYVLHLHSIRVMARQWRSLQGLERLVGEIGTGDPDADAVAPAGRTGGARAEGAGEDGSGDGDDAGLVRRDFGLGTVAIVKGAMSPRDVSEVMAEQRRESGRTFGDLAVALGHLTGSELEELVQAKHRGRYRAGEVRDARRRIEAYRSSLDPEAPGG